MSVLDFVFLYIAGSIIYILICNKQLEKDGMKKFNEFSFKFPDVKLSYSTYKTVTLVLTAIFWPLCLVVWVVAFIALFFMAIRTIILYFTER